MTKFDWNNQQQVQRMAQLRALNLTYATIAQIITKETGINLNKDDIRLGLQRHVAEAFNIKGGK
ncbi:hypothetical protein [Leuconostoc citreum]|uniref:hypothetical protein n=1 Tax=Leuconostoc citreum TaxID=33964 RepID=UPI001C2010DA|nr:hypothetical protein [Leuconostoc citreum]MBU7451532.1 hypothetical protein [Leuconostoc citreum]